MRSVNEFRRETRTAANRGTARRQAARAGAKFALACGIVAATGLLPAASVGAQTAADRSAGPSPAMLGMSAISASPATRAPAAATAAAPAAPSSPAAITLLAGTRDDTTLTLAAELAAAVARRGVRVLPSLGHTGADALSFLIADPPIADLAITQTDVMEHAARTGSHGSDITQRVGILAKLHDAEVHLLAGRGIDRIEDLAGKEVGVGAAGSGAAHTAAQILEALAIKATPVHGDGDDDVAALDRIASGDIAAAFIVTGKPARALSRRALPEGVRFIAIPYAEALEATYIPARLTHADYPALVAEGAAIDTVSVGIVIAGRRDRSPGRTADRTAPLVDALFPALTGLRQPPHHAKWKDMHVAAGVAGFERLPSSAAWLRASLGTSTPLPDTPTAITAASPMPAEQTTGALPAATPGLLPLATSIEPAPGTISASAPPAHAAPARPSMPTATALAAPAPSTPAAAPTPAAPFYADVPSTAALASAAAADPNTDPILAFTQAARAANGNPALQEQLFKEFLARSAASKSSEAALLSR